MTNFNASSIAHDGDFLYIHSLTKGLVRINSVGLEAGKVCGPSNPKFHIGVAGHMALLGKKIYFFYQAKTSEVVSTVFYVDTIDIQTLEIISTHILTFGSSERNISETNAEHSRTNNDEVLQLELKSEMREAEKLAAANEKGDQENAILSRDRRKAADLMQVPIEAIIKEEETTKESAKNEKKRYYNRKTKTCSYVREWEYVVLCSNQENNLVLHTVEVDANTNKMHTDLRPAKRLQFNGKHSKIGWQNISSSDNAVVTAINCGGGEFTDGDGIRFLKDQYYGQDDKEFGSGGGFLMSHSGHETAQSLVCHSCRFRKGSFWYNIPVPHGKFVVSLIFCELESSSRSHRLFDVYVDDELVMHQFNPGAENIKKFNTIFQLQ